MERPCFSVVIPSYNYAHVLPRAVSSVMQQTSLDYELLVINDASTDETREVLEQLNAQFKDKFRYVHLDKNRGLGAVRNYGIAHTSGEWLLFLDSDDALLPDALQHFSKAISRHSDARFFIGGHRSIHADGKEKQHRVCLQWRDWSKEKSFKAYLLDKEIFLVNGATLIHRSVFEGVRYPEHFHTREDIPVFAYIMANMKYEVLPIPVAEIHKHSDSLRHCLKYSDVKVFSDYVFDPQRIPIALQKYKKQFVVQYTLSIFRGYYVAKQYKKAWTYYVRALQEYWMAVFKIRYTRKALRAALLIIFSKKS